MPNTAVLFRRHLDPAITGERLLGQMLADFPGLDRRLLSTEIPDSTSDVTLVLKYGTTEVTITDTTSETAADLTELTELSRLWLDTEPAPTDCRVRTVVAVAEPGPDAGSEAESADPPHVSAIAGTALLSQAIASAIALTDSVTAVYFAAADHVIVPQLFRELAIETLPQPILPAWVALNVAPRADGVMTGHTRGLDALNLMDIEIPASPESAEETFNRIASISVYLLQNGPVIGDGDTLGAAADADVVAHHGPSALDAGHTVLQLSFGDATPAPPPEPRKRGWFRRK